MSYGKGKKAVDEYMEWALTGKGNKPRGAQQDRGSKEIEDAAKELERQREAARNSGS